ncbi:unnamed protein product [Psylliodes chrysocephalus]|uniref:MI domain-containing protein n=1 Tax=Psylliodes chrysocephalus TaxID=3402493 RepID=A0A9P0CYA9_9CUCU|nr:unnamed protein product [Psylliodes chrysocephala]
MDFYRRNMLVASAALLILLILRRRRRQRRRRRAKRLRHRTRQIQRRKVLLEAVDPEYLKRSSHQELEDADDEFEEDLALMSGKKPEKNKKLVKKSNQIDSEEDSDSESDETSSEDSLSESDEDEEDDDDDEVEDEQEENDSINSEHSGEPEVDFDSEEMSIDEEKEDSISNISNSKNNVLKNDKLTSIETKSVKRKAEEIQKSSKKSKLTAPEDENSDIAEKDGVDELSDQKSYNSEEASDENDDFEENSDGGEEIRKGAVKQFPDGTWEDIYGRLRAKDGTVITKSTTQSKYIPPAMREQMNKSQPEDKKRQEKLNRLKKQLKGLLNRLAESNMHGIATQIEELYMNNSRNDMNDTLTNLIMDSLVTEVLSPERLLIEHVVLLTVLHANVGTEVGAHFLQRIVRNFDESLHAAHEVENKTLDNAVRIIAQLYNFKLFDSKLIYEVLRKLAGGFKEKDVECILHVLRMVGFGLRKDDPLALKDLILELQHRANEATDEEKDNSRVKFMLDILLAIKNNNVTKIPNYDVSYSEHLKKVMKGFIRKGNYVTVLNISLEDLLKADERGRWWVVGSAWIGNDLDNREKSDKSSTTSEVYSSKLMELARKQRMNTDIRRNIFCIIMSAEDYLDAFEKLLKLGLKNAQEREIINVLLHCCLQEKSYNPYYGFLAQKFCDFERKYQLTIKYSIWDKLKAIGDHSGPQLSNLAKLLIHLFVEKGLPISILKVVQFSELDKTTLRFMRQILLGILLHKDMECCVSVFARVSQSDKLKLFRESLRLFIHHFLLRNLKTDKIPEDEKTLIEGRVKIVEKVLTSKNVKII